MPNPHRTAAGVQVELLESRRLMSTTFYVAPSGNDGSAGDAAHPFATIQQAVTASNPGDTVDVRPGNYTGFVLGWDGNDSGTPAAPVTFHGESGAVITSRNARTPDGIDVEGSSYVVIEGFTVNNASGTITRAGIRSVINTGVVIRNNVVDGCGTWGVFTGFSENVVIENNVASHSRTQHGIYVSNSADNPVIRGNTVFGNADCGIQINADGSQGGDGIITGAVIDSNVIYDNGARGGSGINLDGVQRSTIENNLLYDNHASGVSLYQIDGSGPSKDNVVVNNTIVMPVGSRWALNIQNASTGNAAYNNILYDANPNHGAIDISSDSLSGFASDNNAVDGRFTTDDGNSVMTLAEWQAATHQDAHSFATIPDALFAGAMANDYRLSAGSAAVDAGAATDAPATDIVGTARPQGNGIDIGAYERPGAPAAAATLFNSAAPTSPESTDARRSELGVRFHSDVDGYVAAIRFVKGADNTGVHNGHLWTADGRMLGRVKFTNESASGWQVATFAAPVHVAAGATFVASYHTNTGHYGADPGYFASAAASGPLHVDAEAPGDPASVFAHGRVRRFPSRDGGGANFWVDVVFAPTAQAVPAPAARAPLTQTWSIEPITVDSVSDLLK